MWLTAVHGYSHHRLGLHPLAKNPAGTHGQWFSTTLFALKLHAGKVVIERRSRFDIVELTCYGDRQWICWAPEPEMVARLCCLPPATDNDSDDRSEPHSSTRYVSTWHKYAVPKWQCFIVAVDSYVADVHIPWNRPSPCPLLSAFCLTLPSCGRPFGWPPTSLLHTHSLLRLCTLLRHNSQTQIDIRPIQLRPFSCLTLQSTARLTISSDRTRQILKARRHLKSPVSLHLSRKQI